MTFPELLEAQWSDYPERHRNKTNLLIHIVAVPVFWFGAIELLGGVLLFLLGVPGGFATLVWAVVLIGASVFAQNRGDAMETTPPAAAKSPQEFAQRVVAEQFITFPRFVGSGGWLANLRNAG